MMRKPGYDEDRFFVDLDDGYIEWMYFNPDANSGGQYVINQFRMEHFVDAMVKYPKGSVKDIFNHVAQNCKQYLVDKDTPFYKWCAIRFENDAIATGISNETFAHITDLFLAAEMIDSYCMEEFDCLADFSDLRNIGLAYTTTEDGKYEIQVNANLRELRIEINLDKDTVLTWDFGSLEEMIYDYLIDLDFDELTTIPDEILEDMEEITSLCDGCERLYDLHEGFIHGSNEIKQREKKEKESR